MGHKPGSAEWELTMASDYICGFVCQDRMRQLFLQIPGNRIDIAH